MLEATGQVRVSVSGDSSDAPYCVLRGEGDAVHRMSALERDGTCEFDEIPPGEYRLGLQTRYGEMTSEKDVVVVGGEVVECRLESRE